MSSDPQDFDWIGPLLADHAARHDIDVDRLVARVMTQVDASMAGQDPSRVAQEVLPVRARHRGRREARPDAGRARRWRLSPVVLAAASVLLVATVATAVPGLARWSSDDRDAGTVQPGTVPSETVQPGAGQVDGTRPATSGPASPAPTVRLGSPSPGASAGASPSAPRASAGTSPGASAGAPPGAAPRVAVGAPASTSVGAAPSTVQGGSIGTAGSQGLPSVLRWSSTGPLIAPRPDAGHPITGVKDPTVVFHGGRWHVFATVVSSAGYGLEYRSFTDWSQAGSATPFYLDRSGIGAGYRAAPQVFYFAPQKLWYLVFQTGNASYSTNPDIADPAGWSAPKNFYPGMPAIVAQNIGSGFWVDMWVICDSSTCYLFSSDENGRLYRSQTSLAAFPNGMSQPVIALQETDPNRLHEAAKVFAIAGSDRYLLLGEAIGSDGRRYARSWTAPGPTGPWTPLADSQTAPFAGAGTVTFAGTPWTVDISHGEPLRAGEDQTLTIGPCQLQYLYVGRDLGAGGSQQALPWRLGLLTQTGSTC